MFEKVHIFIYFSCCNNTINKTGGGTELKINNQRVFKIAKAKRIKVWAAECLSSNKSQAIAAVNTLPLYCFTAENELKKYILFDTKTKKKYKTEWRKWHTNIFQQGRQDIQINMMQEFKKIINLWLYSSQGTHTGQLDFCNWLADGSTTG